MVVASPNASFGLPEATVGLYAAAGGLPRIVRNVGLQVGSEIAMISQETVIDEAVEMAKKVAGLSPDAIIVTRAGLREAWETGSVERATQRVSDRYDMHLFEGENMKIGLDAFAAKKKPQWVPSKI